MADTGLGLGNFASGMANGMQIGMKAQELDERRKLEEQQKEREEETRRQQEQMRANLQSQNQAQQQGMWIDPSMASSFFSQSGSGSAAGGAAGGTAGTGSSGAAVGGGSAAGGAGVGGGSAAGGSSSAGSAVAAAGPWAALAAIIAVNERSARNGGHRADGFQYAKDLVGGKVLEQDTNGRWSQKLGGYDDDKTGLLNDAGAGAEITTLDFKNGFKKLTQGGTPSKLIGGLKKIF